MKNNDTFQNYTLPYCSYIKARIKNDFGYTIDIISQPFLFNDKEYENLQTIFGKYNLNSNNIESTYKLIIEIKTYFSLYDNDNNNNNITQEKEYLDDIVTFLGLHLSESIINENKISNNNHSEEEIENIIEPNIFISTINQLALFYFKYIGDKNNTFYLGLIDIIYNSLKNTDINSFTEETILSYLRTIDNLISISRMERYNISELYYCINIMKNLLLKNIISGTHLRLNGNNFDIYLIKPDYYTEELSIENNKRKEERNEYSFMQYKNYKIENNKNIKNLKPFESDFIFSMARENYDLLYDEITYLKNEKITDLIISILKIKNENDFHSKWNNITNNIYQKNHYKMPEIVDSSIIIQIENPINRKVINNVKKLRYNISFELQPQFLHNNEYIVCLALNSLIIKDDNIDISKNEKCLTYIDPSKHKIICDCNTNGEIVVLFDKKIAALSKSFLYEKQKYKMINSLSGSIIFSTLALITIFSVCFIFYEFYEDKNIISSVRVHTEYENFKKIRSSGKCLFALYILYYKYSFLNVFSTYKYYHPRYVRFSFEIIKVLLNLLFSIIPIYYYSYYENNSIFIFTSNNFIFSLKDSFKSFSFSFLASIIIFIVFLLINKLFDFEKIRRAIWKPKKDIIKQWIYCYLKKETIFHKKLKPLKMRMLAYANICGRFVLKNKPKENFAKYLEYKFSQQNPKASINDYDFNSFPFYKINTNINNNDYKIPLLHDESDKKYKKDKKLRTDLYKVFSINNNKISNNIEKINNKKLFITRGVQPFMLSSKNNNNISMWRIYRIESIKNRYMYRNKSNYRDTNSKIIKYFNLKMQTQKNYSYIFSNDLYINNLNNNYIKSKINKIRFVNICLFIFLSIIDTAIAILMNKLYEIYEKYLIINWLIPVLVQIFIFNIAINYIFALISTYLLFSYYQKKNYNCWWKCIFYIFVEKYMKYLFKIRTLIQKYYREFENMR